MSRSRPAGLLAKVSGRATVWDMKTEVWLKVVQIDGGHTMSWAEAVDAVYRGTRGPSEFRIEAADPETC